jgi:hypothetical protein
MRHSIIGREYREGGLCREYKLHPDVAELVKRLHLGSDGYSFHTPREIAIQVLGIGCQLSGQDLIRLSNWTLGDSLLDWGIQEGDI